MLGWATGPDLGKAVVGWGTLTLPYACGSHFLQLLLGGLIIVGV